MLKKLATLLAGVTLLIGSVVSAQALTLKLDDLNGNTVEIFGVDAGSGVKTATFSGTLGDWDLLMAAGVATTNQGTPDFHLNTVVSNYLGSKSGDLQVTLLETLSSGWTAPGFLNNLGGALSASIGTTGVFDIFINNVLVKEYNIGPGAFAKKEDISYFDAAVGDEITLKATIHHSGYGTSSVDWAINPVPEPGTMVLLGAGLLSLAIFGKRRMNRE